MVHEQAWDGPWQGVGAEALPKGEYTLTELNVSTIQDLGPRVDFARYRPPPASSVGNAWGSFAVDDQAAVLMLALQLAATNVFQQHLQPDSCVSGLSVFKFAAEAMPWHLTCLQCVL